MITTAILIILACIICVFYIINKVRRACDFYRQALYESALGFNRIDEIKYYNTLFYQYSTAICLLVVVIICMLLIIF